MRAADLLSDITKNELLNMIDICISENDVQNLHIIEEIIRNFGSIPVQVIGKLSQRFNNNLEKTESCPS